MKLKFNDRCEQGTDQGVMVFRKGAEYAAEPQADGAVLITHEPRPAMRRVDGKRVAVQVTQTTVPQSLLDKLLQFGPVTKE